MKRVIIVGAGIAGLSCGIYARQNGFETEIYEMHSIPGGECTGWDRGEYHFDGCIHWLMGSKPGTGLHQVWLDTGALDGKSKIINHNVFTRYEEGGNAVNLYTDADNLEKHLLEISPEDKTEIKKLCSAIRSLGDFGMPVEKPMDMMTMSDGLKFAAKNLGKLSKMSRYNKATLAEFAGWFKSGLLQRAFLSSIPGSYQATALVMTLASMHAGDSGFPAGGSRALAKRMEQKFLKLGGKAEYNAKADKIIIKDGKAAGIQLLDGREVYGDIVVSCADGYYTLYHMLEDKYTPGIYRNLFENPKKYPTPTCALVFLGVGCEIKEKYRAIAIKRNKPALLGGATNETVSLLNYNFDDSMAPKGKTVLGCMYNADFDYWNELHKDKEKYKAEKEKLIQDTIQIVNERYPETVGKIEEKDAVTPVTYVRYCNAWRGSWMSWGSEKDAPRYHSGILPGLENFIMAGMWTLPPGGLPGAVTSGRYAAHRLCIREGIPFKTK